MVVPSTFSNVIIEGNTIDLGSSSSGNTPTFYTYGGPGSVPGQNGYLLLTNANCRIFNNYFSGITTNTSNNYMLGLIACSCNIQGNTFVRGASEISAYIISAGNFDHMITGNIFDGYTVDGYTPQATAPLVTGTTANTLYTNNKNQVGYATIPLGTNKTAISYVTKSAIPAYSVFNTNTGVAPSSNDYGVLSGYLFDPYVLLLFDESTSPAQNFFSINIDITKSIPIGAKIIDAKFSAYNYSYSVNTFTLNTSGINTFSLTLVAGLSHLLSIDTKTYANVGTLSTMIGYEAAGTLTINAGNLSSIQNGYQVIEIPTLNFTGLAGPPSSITSLVNTDISRNYVAGNDYGLTASIRIFYEASATGVPDIPLLVISPLIITYVF